MRPYVFILALLLAPAAARAQVVINQAALDQLAGISRPVTYIPDPDVPEPAPKPVHHVTRKAVPEKAVTVAKPDIALPRPVLIPVVAKPAPPKPPKPPAPKPVAPVVLNFAAGSTALPAGAAAALRPVCENAASGGLVGIDAYAPGAANDPSAPMRLSLARAFAVRDALTACGIPAANIVPRADGASSGGADTARVSVTPP